MFMGDHDSKGDDADDTHGVKLTIIKLQGLLFCHTSVSIQGWHEVVIFADFEVDFLLYAVWDRALWDHNADARFG